MGNHFGDIRWLEGREGFQYLGGVMYAAKGAGGGGRPCIGWASSMSDGETLE